MDVLRFLSRIRVARFDGLVTVSFVFEVHTPEAARVLYLFMAMVARDFAVRLGVNYMADDLTEGEDHE